MHRVAVVYESSNYWWGWILQINTFLFLSFEWNNTLLTLGEMMLTLKPQDWTCTVYMPILRAGKGEEKVYSRCINFEKLQIICLEISGNVCSWTKFCDLASKCTLHKLIVGSANQLHWLPGLSPFHHPVLSSSSSWWPPTPCQLAVRPVVGPWRTQEQPPPLRPLSTVRYMRAGCWPQPGTNSIQQLL